MNICILAKICFVSKVCNGPCCCVELQAKIDRLEMKLKHIEDSIDNIVKKKLDEIQKTNIAMNAKVLAFMNQLSKNMADPEIMLPIKNEEEISSMDAAIKETPQKYNKLFQSTLQGGISSNMERVFSKDLIIRMNYNGEYGKISLRKYANICIIDLAGRTHV
ncbi:uncharacterized protein LOC116655061 isoform X1 [Drosophila ananassae]|nr:uncharacterized protein LOC116655060 isoform X1 [Drosophila ananassae]XP_032307985.1 uncharacterized protein LOC116655061 isoform X1 [Drosophila ananassae]